MLRLSKPLNWLLGGFFSLFNRGFDLAGRAYTRIVGGMLRVTVLVLLFYVGLLCLTGYGYVGFPKGLLSDKFIAKLEKGKEHEKLAWLKPLVQFPGHSQGVHPVPGHGIPDDQRATARLGLDGAHARGLAEDAGDRPEDAGRRTLVHDLGAIAALERVRIELWLDVRDARRFRRASPADDQSGSSPGTPRSNFEDWWRETLGLGRNRPAGQAGGRLPGALVPQGVSISRSAVAQQRHDCRIAYERNSRSRSPRHWSWSCRRPRCAAWDGPAASRS